MTPLKEALTALADALAKCPAEEISLDQDGERRHPEVQAEIDRVYQEHLTKLGKTRRDPAGQDD